MIGAFPTCKHLVIEERECGQHVPCMFHDKADHTAKPYVACRPVPCGEDLPSLDLLVQPEYRWRWIVTTRALDAECGYLKAFPSWGDAINHALALAGDPQ